MDLHGRNNGRRVSALLRYPAASSRVILKLIPWSFPAKEAATHFSQVEHWRKTASGME